MIAKRRHGSFRVATTGLVLLAAMTAAAGAQAAHIRVRASAEIHSATVSLGDVAVIDAADQDFADRLRSVVLADAPHAGGTLAIRARDIRGILKNAGANIGELHIYGSAACEVSRPHERPEPQAPRAVIEHKPAKPLRRHADSVPQPAVGTVEAALRDYIAAHFAPAGGRIEVSFNRTSRTVRELLDAPYDRAAYQFRERDPIGLGLCALEVEPQGGDAPGDATAVVASVELVKPVLIARKPINRGSTIDKRELKIEERRVSRIEEVGYSDLELVAGYEATRFIRPGEMLTPRSLRERPLVERGEQVKILIVGDGVQITARGKAQESGALGDVIPVARDGSRRKSDLIDAVISGPGVVTYGGLRQVASR